MKKTILCLLLALGLLLMGAAAMADSDPGNNSFNIDDGSITIKNGTNPGTIMVQYGNDEKKDNIAPDTIIGIVGTLPQNGYQLTIEAQVPVKIRYCVQLDDTDFTYPMSIAANADVTLELNSDHAEIFGTVDQPAITLGSGSKLTLENSITSLRLRSGTSAISGPTNSEAPATVILNSGVVSIDSDSGSGISGNVNLVINGGVFRANGKGINVKNLIVIDGILLAGNTIATYLNRVNFQNIKCDKGILRFDNTEQNQDMLCVFGDLELPFDLTIPDGKKLTLHANNSLTIPEDRSLTCNNLQIASIKTLTNKGTLTINHGATNVESHLSDKLINEGTLIIEKDILSISLSGTLINTGTISGSGSITPPERRLTLQQPASLTVESIENGTVTLSAPANTNATTEYCAEGTTWQDSPTFTGGIPTQGRTFYARYKANNFFNASDKTSITVFPVSLNANGGTIASGKDVTYYIDGQGKPLPTEDDTTRENYSFAGWYDNEALTGDAVTEITKDATGEKKYWAKWTLDTYTVALNANGGTIGSGNVTSYTYGEGATLPTDVTRAGYTFAGWYDNEALTGSPVTAIGATETGKREYWAKWVIVLTDPDGAVVSGDAAFAKLPPVKVPTLVLPEGTTPGGSVMLKYVEVDTTRENTAVYDIYLVDQDGNRVKLPDACTLCLPYPEGLNQSSASAYRIHILHEMDGGRSEDFDSVSGGLELTPQGLCVRISSLSPFTITWERFPEVNLPQTGDSSRPALWLALGLVSAAALAAFALRGRKNGKA